ncbi:hypothetical protein [Tolypothrix sp. NIES-4075]|nr:hypothetical protein [Tolypothrix sp. NIES-4075]
MAANPDLEFEAYFQAIAENFGRSHSYIYDNEWYAKQLIQKIYGK